MLNPIKIISEINNFSVNNNHLTYINSEHCELEVCLLSGETISTYKSPEKGLINDVNLAANDLVWTVHQGPFSVVFKHNKFLEIATPVIGYLCSDGSSYVVEMSSPRMYKKLDKDKNVIWEIVDDGIGSTYPTLDYCFFRKGHCQLTCLNNQTGEELWTYTLPEGEYDYKDVACLTKTKKARISKVLGVYQGNVWLLIANSSLIALDKTTGEQTAYVMSPDSYQDEKSDKVRQYYESNKNINIGAFNFSQNLHLDTDTDTGTLFSFAFSVYLEIDLNNPSFPLTAWDITETLAAQADEISAGFSGLRVGSWEKNNVYVRDHPFFSERFGLFDRATKKIIWSEFFDGRSKGVGNLNDIKHANGYLFIHANGLEDINAGSLHIYRIEKQ